MALDLTISTGRFSRSSSEPASRQFESNYTNINQSILTGALFWFPLFAVPRCTGSGRQSPELQLAVTPVLVTNHAKQGDEWRVL